MAINHHRTFSIVGPTSLVVLAALLGLGLWLLLTTGVSSGTVSPSNSPPAVIETTSEST